MKSVRGILTLGCSVLLFGCAHNIPEANGPMGAVNAPPVVSDAAGNEIAEAAASVSQSLSNLEAVERASMSPRVAGAYDTVGVVSVPGISSVDWNGLLEPLVRQIASASGYHLKIIGVSPIPPIVVAVHAEQATNSDILRNAGLQANGRATIKSIPATKVIELRYLGR